MHWMLKIYCFTTSYGGKLMPSQLNCVDDNHFPERGDDRIRCFEEDKNQVCMNANGTSDASSENGKSFGGLLTFT